MYFFRAEKDNKNYIKTILSKKRHFFVLFWGLQWSRSVQNAQFLLSEKILTIWNDDSGWLDNPNGVRISWAFFYGVYHLVAPLFFLIFAA